VNDFLLLNLLQHVKIIISGVYLYSWWVQLAPSEK